jgi:hypothetical protein
MNIQKYFTQTFKQTLLILGFVISFLSANIAQCTLIGTQPNNPNFPLNLPVSPTCMSYLLQPASFLSNLATNCPDGTTIGLFYNLKIYDAAGVTPVYDMNNGGGSLTGFPIVNINALGLAGQKRKIRVERIPTGQFIDMYVRFNITIACPSPTLEANDNLTLTNPLLTPTLVSACAGVSLAPPSAIFDSLCITNQVVTNLLATDPSGNSQQITRLVKTSNFSTGACNQTINIKRITLPGISFPANYTDATNKGCAFTNANRHPNNTKFPVLIANNKELSLATAVAGTPYTIGNIEITFTDVLQATCAGEVFIKRTWSLKDLFNPGTPPMTQVQDIRSKEIVPPTIQPIASVTVNASPTSCNALNFNIPTVFTSDNCGAVTVTATITGSSIAAIVTTNGASIPSLATGNYMIKYTATDDCGNPSVLNVTMNVIDATTPSLTCSSKMISISNAGIGMANATNFVTQLSDNCGANINSVQIKRMNDPNSAYASTISVSCADVNKPFMVILKANDLAGNVNYCMTTIETQDKLAPQILANTLDSVVNCPVDTNYLKSLNPQVVDGCGFTLKKEIKNWTIANCQTGTFNICYTATDTYGNVATVSRKITVVNNNPFTKAMITRPKDITIKNFLGPISFLEPEKLDTGAYAPAVPKWNYNGCDLIAVSRKDDVFNYGGSSCCYKILRTWKIANCCMMDPAVAGPKIIDEFVQVIKIEDTIAPEFKSAPADVTVGSTNCNAATLTLPTNFNLLECGTTIPGNTVNVTTNLPNQKVGDKFTYLNVPKGIYDVTYTAADGCGNFSTHTFKVCVKDLKSPTPIAKNGLAGTLDMTSGELMVSAKTFNQGSYDNCTPANKLIYAFSPDPKDTTLMFDCNSFKPKCDSTELFFSVALWVRDEAGNWSHVDTYMKVSKANSPCTCFKSIAGAIQTTKGDKVQNVMVNITSNGVSIVKPFTTNVNGAFSVPTITSGKDYIVAPQKNDDALNGVSTADILMITKHILGKELFTTPYQWIAADINKNGKISTADLVELRKMVLGTNKLFISNTSWRFVDKNYKFKNTASPLDEVFPEIKTVKGSDSNTDFLGIKIGDLNNTASVNGAVGSAGDRSGEALEFMVNDMELTKGNTYTIPFMVKNLEDIAGYQFTLGFDKNNVEFVNITHNNNGADADFGLTHLDEGMVTTSWINPTNLPFKKMETVFQLTLKAKNNTSLNKLFKFTSDLTKAEAYNQQGTTMDVKLNYMSTTTATVEAKTDKFELYQNQPNPFSRNTVVSFNLPTAAHATLTIYDQTGRIVQRMDDDFNKGKNEVKLEVLAAAGLYFYKLDTPEYSSTRKMILLD